MKIGCPTEIKPQEFRVGLTPNAAQEAIPHGHEVIVQAGAGVGAGFDDADYTAAGCTAIAYETVTDRNGGLPLLAPMSEVAGRLAPQVGAWTLQKANGGRGVLMGGVPGVGPAKVMVIGGGVVGTHAARIAAGMGADVTVLDRSLPRMRYLDDIYGGTFKTAYASAGNTIELARQADMIIGAVLIPGAALVDVAIDQGGCFETSKATTHQDPVYEVDGIMHYCVANMPGAVARTSTIALGNATMPFMLALADKGWKQACADDPHLKAGLNVHSGKLTYAAVGEALGIESITADQAIVG